MQDVGEDQPGLFRGLDQDKDQSYVLFGIEREISQARDLSGLGDTPRRRFERMSRQAGIQTANKPDSQEICFIPDNDYAGFLTRYRGEQDTAGELVDTAGQVLGHHTGFQQFTIGQRKGLGIAFGEPRFVVRIEPDTRRVVIGTKSDLGRTSLEADRLNWLVSPHPPKFAAPLRSAISTHPLSAPAMVRR